jgi:transcriptional regulator with XRE-family HTH domain
MPTGFGARMRQQREAQGVSLARIAEDTKIKLSLLEALERDEVSHWPTGIFRRAYLRAYAQAIGLDPEAVLREFLELYPDPTEAFFRDEEIEQPERPGAPPTRLRYIVGAALGTLTRLRPATADGEAAPHATAFSTAIERRAQSVEPPQEPLPDNEMVATTGTTAVHVGAPSDIVLPGPDVAVLAGLCTALGRVDSAEEISPVLREFADLIDAAGIIVWIPDETGKELKPALAHGYSDRVLAYLPSVWTDADSATATAYRETRPCTIAGDDHQNGALVLPLLTPGGCSGVLALELRNGGERNEAVRGFATIVAALLAQLTCQAQGAKRYEGRGSGPEKARLSVNVCA